MTLPFYQVLCVATGSCVTNVPYIKKGFPNGEMCVIVMCFNHHATVFLLSLNVDCRCVLSVDATRQCEGNVHLSLILPADRFRACPLCHPLSAGLDSKLMFNFKSKLFRKRWYTYNFLHCNFWATLGWNINWSFCK